MQASAVDETVIVDMIAPVVVAIHVHGHVHGQDHVNDNARRLPAQRWRWSPGSTAATIAARSRGTSRNSAIRSTWAAGSASTRS